MRFLLDTNVISETGRDKPAPEAARWMTETPLSEQAISILTVGELEFGVRRLDLGDRKAQLRRWLDRLVGDHFQGRVLPIDDVTVGVWADIRVAAGRTLPTIDCLIAATALARDLTLVTRNVRDFQIPGLRVLDPWR